MITISALFGLCLAIQDDAAIRDLVQKLQDDSIDVREAASRDLARIGKAAKPLLEEAEKRADADWKLRIREVLGAIAKGERLSTVFRAPTRITVEAKGRSLREVLEEIQKQGPTPLDLTAVPPEEKVTVSLAGVPFWQALDAVCAANGRFTHEVASDKVVLKKRPYVALPRHYGGPVALYYSNLQTTVSGPFVGGNLTERLDAHFRVCWEKGTKPDRVRLLLLALEDDKGTDLQKAGIAPTYQVSQQDIPADHLGIARLVLVQKVPDPAASKLVRLKCELLMEFDLELAGLTFKMTELKLPATQKCEKFSATLQSFKSAAGVVSLSLQMAPLDGRAETMAACRFVLKDKDGKTHNPILYGNAMNDKVWHCNSSFQAKELGEIVELSISAPRSTHAERFEVEIKDLPLK